jgi:hypothetical protein
MVPDDQKVRSQIGSRRHDRGRHLSGEVLGLGGDTKAGRPFDRGPQYVLPIATLSRTSIADIDENQLCSEPCGELSRRLFGYGRRWRTVRSHDDLAVGGQNGFMTMR